MGSAAGEGPRRHSLTHLAIPPPGLPWHRRRHARARADHVLPPLLVRPWVLSLPKRIRPFLPHDPRLAGGVPGTEVQSSTSE